MAFSFWSTHEPGKLSAKTRWRKTAWHVTPARSEAFPKANLAAPQQPKQGHQEHHTVSGKRSQRCSLNSSCREPPKQGHHHHQRSSDPRAGAQTRMAQAIESAYDNGAGAPDNRRQHQKP